jgi:anti-sigma factor RsiW
MNKDLKHIEEIDNYLSGELSVEARNEFEKRLTQDNNLQDELVITKRVIAAVKGYAFKNMIKEIHEENLSKDKEG